MLRFPNPCRSFDASKGRVCFWGYDCAIEVSFFIATDALKLLCPEMRDMESGFLQTFDAERERIHDLANRVYERDNNGTYSHFLSAKDVQG